MVRLAFCMYYGPEFIARALRAWLCSRWALRRCTSSLVAPGRTALASFNGTPKDELLNGEIFYNLKEARIVIERWRREYNEDQPHSTLGYRLPAPAPAAYSPKPLTLAQPQMLQ